MANTYSETQEICQGGRNKHFDASKAAGEGVIQSRACTQASILVLDIGL